MAQRNESTSKTKFITAKDIAAEKAKIEKEFAARLEKFLVESEGIMVLSLGLETTKYWSADTPFVVQLRLLVE